MPTSAWPLAALDRVGFICAAALALAGAPGIADAPRRAAAYAFGAAAAAATPLAGRKSAGIALRVAFAAFLPFVVSGRFRFAHAPVASWPDWLLRRPLVVVWFVLAATGPVGLSTGAHAGLVGGLAAALAARQAAPCGAELALIGGEAAYFRTAASALRRAAAAATGGVVPLRGGGAASGPACVAADCARVMGFLYLASASAGAALRASAVAGGKPGWACVVRAAASTAGLVAAAVAVAAAADAGADVSAPASLTPLVPHAAGLAPPERLGRVARAAAGDAVAAAAALLAAAARFARGGDDG